MKKLFILFLLVFNSLLSFSQGEFLIEIDTATGSFSHIGGAIKGIHWVYPNIRAYDETHGAYIFQGGNPLVDSLYSIKVTNGSIISNPYFAPSGNCAREPKYDNIKDTLYGLYWNSSLSEFYFSWINPITGVYTQIGTTPIVGLSATAQGATAYDEVNRRYFAIENNQLFCINATNGSLISNPTLNSSPNGQLMHFWYNNSTNTLNGLMQTTSTPQLSYLVSINTTTGVLTNIGNGINFGSGGGSSAIDRINQRYMYTYSIGNSSFHIVTLDIATGNVISNKLLSLSSGDNIHSIAFDNIKGKLYGIQWDSDTSFCGDCTGISQILTINNQISIYPNPSNGNFVIEPKVTTKQTLQIVDVNGKLVLTQSIRGKANIDATNLSEGVYNLSIINSTGIINKKLVIVK